MTDDDALPPSGAVIVALLIAMAALGVLGLLLSL
jgi:hypothetical protein